MTADRDALCRELVRLFERGERNPLQVAMAAWDAAERAATLRWRTAIATRAEKCGTCDGDGFMFVEEPIGSEIDHPEPCAECGGTGRGAVAVALAEARREGERAGAGRLAPAATALGSIARSTPLDREAALVAEQALQRIAQMPHCEWCPGHPENSGSQDVCACHVHIAIEARARTTQESHGDEKRKRRGFALYAEIYLGETWALNERNAQRVAAERAERISRALAGRDSAPERLVVSDIRVEEFQDNEEPF